MRFFVYKNSILATICSMFGASAAAFAGMTLISGEMGILPGICVTALGVGLMFLAEFISEQKAAGKRAKAGAAAAGTRVRTAPSVGPEDGKPVKLLMILAGICFLLTLPSQLWSHGRFVGMAAVLRGYPCLLVGTVLLSIAAFRTAASGNAFLLFLLGFVSMAVSTFNILRMNAVMFPLRHASVVVAFLKGHPIISWALLTLAYILMAVFALCTMGQDRQRTEKLLRRCWFIPVLLVLYPEFVGILRSDRATIFRIMLLDPEQSTILYGISQLGTYLSVSLTALCFRWLALPKAAAETAAGPEQGTGETVLCPRCHHSNPGDGLFCVACGQSLSGSQPEPQTEPEPQPEPKTEPQPEAPPRAADPETLPEEIRREIEACRDLLECGILTQEEYDQKVSQLMGRQ